VSNLNPASLSIESPTLKVKLEGMKSSEENKYLERAFQPKVDQIIKEQSNTNRVVAEAMDNLKDINNISSESV